MRRSALTSLAFALSLACAIPVATVAQAQDSRDPANARNLYDQQDPKNSRLNDPADARNINSSDDRRDPADARNVDDKGNKRDVK